MPHDPTMPGVIDESTGPVLSDSVSIPRAPSAQSLIAAPETPEAAWRRCAAFFMSAAGERWIREHQCNCLLPPYQLPAAALVQPVSQCAHIHDDGGAYGVRCTGRVVANGYCDYHQFLAAPGIAVSR